jgi:hypothetical protein
MTLKEKFDNVTDPIEWDTDGVTPQEQLVKIADDFAIGFFEWCVSQEALDLINDLVLVGEINKATTSKELLEIYKKEKGL